MTGYADGDEISTAKLATLHDTGKMCAHCGSEFVKPHGSPTSCRYCFRRLSAEERGDTPLAVHEEVNKAAHANEARKRKHRRQQSNG